MVHVLLKPDLENFEHYFTGCYMSAVVCSFEHSLALTFFGIWSGQHDLLLLLVLLLITWKWFLSHKVPCKCFLSSIRLMGLPSSSKKQSWEVFVASLSFSVIICKMEHIAYAMLLSDLMLFLLPHHWMMNQVDLPYSRLQGHPPYHPTSCLCHLPDVVWLRHTSKRRRRYSSFMTGKEFLEFQIEPVSGDTAESGQEIWARVWKLPLEIKGFYPTRDVQLGLGLIWGCFIYGHMVQVFACHKERGLQEVRVSTLILSSAYGSEVWKIFWRKIIKYWILLENYSFLFFTFISFLSICAFLLSE